MVSFSSVPVQQLRVRVAAVEDEELFSGAVVPAGNDPETSPRPASVPGAEGACPRSRLKLDHLRQRFRRLR